MFKKLRHKLHLYYALNYTIFYKTILWRILSILLGFVVGWFLGFSFGGMTKFTLIFNASAMVLYYLHELFWVWLGKGKTKRYYERY